MQESSLSWLFGHPRSSKDWWFVQFHYRSYLVLPTARIKLATLLEIRQTYLWDDERKWTCFLSKVTTAGPATPQYYVREKFRRCFRYLSDFFYLQQQRIFLPDRWWSVWVDIENGAIDENRNVAECEIFCFNCMQTFLRERRGCPDILKSACGASLIPCQTSHPIIC